MPRAPGRLRACLLALWLAPARSLRRIELASHDNGAEGARPVAICLHGEARVIACDRVWRNIKGAMLDPIRGDADVFVALKARSRHYGPPSCLPGRKDSETELRSFLNATFAPVAMMFRGKDDALGIRTAGVPCVDLIEQEEVRRGGQKYKWVMHLRTDMLLPFSVPKVSEWPKLTPDEKTIFVEDCAEGPGPGDICKYQKSNEPGNLGCTKDTWAVMSRAVVPLYYQRDWNFTRVHEEALRLTRGLGCVQHHIYQCGLGCVLHSHGVTIHSMKMRGLVLHNRNPSQEEVPTPVVAIGLRALHPDGKLFRLVDEDEDFGLGSGE